MFWNVTHSWQTWELIDKAMLSFQMQSTYKRSKSSSTEHSKQMRADLVKELSYEKHYDYWSNPTKVFCKVIKFHFLPHKHIHTEILENEEKNNNNVNHIFIIQFIIGWLSAVSRNSITSRYSSCYEDEQSLIRFDTIEYENVPDIK